jgi:hypothetical protein
MSFRIDPDRPIPKNLRRLSRRQLDMIRLVRPGLGRQYRRANAGVRDAARELSPLRDAHAMERAGEHLARVRARLDRWAPDDDAAIVLSGLTENYRRGRRAFRHALDHPTDAPSTSGGSAPSTAGTTPSFSTRSPREPADRLPVARELLVDGAVR